MKTLDLFSGIGGFSLAATWCWKDELEIKGFVEIDKFCQKVLKKHWPDVSIYDDIFKVKGDEFGTVELVTGGFPCQPFSVAGRQRGKSDDRYLWPEMLRICEIVKPQWIIAENVYGIISLDNGKTLEELCISLENAQYRPEIFIIPACASGAWHRRDRIWILAHSNKMGFNQNSRDGFEQSNQYMENVTRQWDKDWRNESTIYRNCNGLSNRLDRIGALGNAIVPQIAYIIMQQIKQIMECSNANNNKLTESK